MTAGRKRLFAVRVGSHSVPVYRAKLEGGDIGMSWQQAGRPIIVLAPQPRDMEDQTLLHEVIHTIDGVYGLKLTESDVRVLEQGLVEAMRSRPGPFVRLATRKSSEAKI